jgi:hypothetical protein
MQETPIYQGFLHLFGTYISICIVPFSADFIEMQWHLPPCLAEPPASAARDSSAIRS